MAKYIRMTPELKAECRNTFMAELDNVLAHNKFSDGKLSFTKSFGTVDRKAHIYFTEIAWMKTTALLREFSKEVAWHATAYRIPGDKDEYLIRDILVYPQTVTSSTVDMDVDKYSQWIMDGVMAGDERFDHIRCQMHSHVNMGVFASGTDTQHQEEILEQLEEDDFYIFMIWNKSLKVYMRVFDMQKNILFETDDCEWAVLDDTIGLSTFIEDAKKIVVEQKTTYSGYGGNYGGGYGCGYGGGYGGHAGNQGYGRSHVYTPENYSSPYNPVGNASATGKGGQSSGKKEKTKGGGGKKDKKKTKCAACNNACDEQQLSIITSGGEQFDMSDPFGYHDGPYQIT
jgi:hypothetical protein